MGGPAEVACSRGGLACRPAGRPGHGGGALRRGTPRLAKLTRQGARGPARGPGARQGTRHGSQGSRTRTDAWTQRLLVNLVVLCTGSADALTVQPAPGGPPGAGSGRDAPQSLPVVLRASHEHGGSGRLWRAWAGGGRGLASPGEGPPAVGTALQCGRFDPWAGHGGFHECEDADNIDFTGVDDPKVRHTMCLFFFWGGGGVSNRDRGSSVQRGCPPKPLTPPPSLTPSAPRSFGCGQGVASMLSLTASHGA